MNISVMVPTGLIKYLIKFARKSGVICAVLFSLSGCGQDYSLSPPADSEKITVTIKLPKELKTKTMWVMYRSATCKSIGYGASGQRTERDGHHSVYKELERQGQSDLYQVELLKDGGGACRWHLANVTFGVEIANPASYGENVTYGSGGGIIVIFDYNDSPRGGADFDVEGNLAIKKDYYPWLHKSYVSGSTYVNLAGEGYIYIIYKSLQATKVYFEPVFHSGFLLRSEATMIENHKVYTQYTYPDGSVIADGSSEPNFLKLQSLRIGRAGECLSPKTYYKCPDRRPLLLPGWLPIHDKPGFGQYRIVDEWGNNLPNYDYEIVGNDGRKRISRTDHQGLTTPSPKSMHPLREIKFPEYKSWWRP